MNEEEILINSINKICMETVHKSEKGLNKIRELLNKYEDEKKCKQLKMVIKEIIESVE